MITIKQKGDLGATSRFLEDLKEIPDDFDFDKYGQLGVEALRNVTPKDTGATADAWSYRIERKQETISIVFLNSNSPNGVNVAVLIQYGHATRNGGWVEGIDYINPALQPIFEKMAYDMWKEVRRA